MELCANTGNKKNTMAKKRAFCRDFLCDIAGSGCGNVYDINTAYICKAVLKAGNKDSYATIRSFLRHLYDNGTLSNDFSGLIPKYRRAIPLPATYTDKEINLLENSINRTTPEGKRNYAIILLASRLGMRAGDIAGMTFDTIDFNRGRITFIQNKNGQPLSLPLLPEIGEAIQEYIQHARPNVKNNYLFVRLNAPFEGISTSIIRHTVVKHFKAAGIDTSNKKHGPHSLRSSMASSMVNSNVSYAVIRKALGHTDLQAIKHYAKVDIENLRLHAINVPAPTGAFAMVLQGREQAW
jgi:integrase